MAENYDVLKENNLRQMVAEYESVANKRDSERRVCLQELETAGKSYFSKYQAAKATQSEQIMRETKKHYQSILNDMVKDYQIYDLAIQTFPDDRQFSVTPRKSVGQITSKKQLREIVNSFNSQHYR